MVWLDNRLTFATHIREKINKAQAADSKIKSLIQTYIFSPRLVQKIQIAAVQVIALFGSKIWWHRQKVYKKKIQKLLNRQRRAISGMYESTPITPLMEKVGLIPVAIMLDYYQRRYTYRLLTLADGHPIKDILPISLKIGDEKSQPEELQKITKSGLPTKK